MNFNVEARYLEAVNNFTAVTVGNELPIPSNDFEALVNDVAQRIIAASNLKPTLIALSGRNLSLREACYLIAQDGDRQYGKNTPEKIANASPQEKEIVAHVVRKLSQNFVQVTSEDLNALTLLFGIHRIRELAAGNIIAQPQQSHSIIGEMESTLTQLSAMRSQYPAILSEATPQPIRDFIATVDAKIQQTNETLNHLKSQQNQQVI